jgi:transcription initiation factor TFIID subunit TAF12
MRELALYTRSLGIRRETVLSPNPAVGQRIASKVELWAGSPGITPVIMGYLVQQGAALSGTTWPRNMPRRNALGSAPMSSSDMPTHLLAASPMAAAHRRTRAPGTVSTRPTNL